MSPKVACMEMHDITDKIKKYFPDKKETLVGLIVSLHALISYNLHFLSKLGLRGDFMRECPYPFFLKLADWINRAMEREIVEKGGAHQREFSEEELIEYIKNFDPNKKPTF